MDSRATAPAAIPPSPLSSGSPSGPRIYRQLAGRLVATNWIGLLLALVVACIVFSIRSPYFLTIDNWINMSRAIAYTGITAAAMTFVLIAGGLDLSIAGVMALVGVVCGELLKSGVPWIVVIIAGVAIGAGVGGVNAGFIVGVGINPLIVTIGVQFVIRGIAYLIAMGDLPLITDPSFTGFGRGTIWHIPVPAVVLVLAFLVIGWLLGYTRFGLHSKAIGGTAAGAAARLAGVPVRRQQTKAYLLVGVFAAISGIVLAGYTGTGDPSAALGDELTIIAAVIIGGTGLLGGSGSVIGTFVGVVLLGVINNGLTLLNVSTYWQYVVQGTALLLAVVVDDVRRRRGATSYVGAR
jgi:ribose transport system permease protein